MMLDELSTFLTIIKKAKNKLYSAAVAVNMQDEDVVHECAIPKCGYCVAFYDLPVCPISEQRTMVAEFKILFQTLP